MEAFLSRSEVAAALTRRDYRARRRGPSHVISHATFNATDIVGHEFTHNVIETSAKLAYGTTESAALNESFSDIFGNLTFSDFGYGSEVRIALPESTVSAVSRRRR